MFDFVLQTAECLVNNRAKKNNENESSQCFKPVVSGNVSYTYDESFRRMLEYKQKFKM